MDKKNDQTKLGVLYVVATPIGNLDDITLRAVKTLSNVDIVAAEDTRHTGKLLSHFNIKCKLISFHEHNEKNRAEELIFYLKDGLSIALVSDAGTPSVSDPGFRFVKEAVSCGIQVVPIPGVSAVITALSASGIPTDSFIFIGFPQKKKSRRMEQIKSLLFIKRTLIFYESPKRILRFAEELLDILGDRYVVLSREMTKIHEEFIRGNLSELIQILNTRPVIKGECTLIVEGCSDKKETISQDALKDEISARLTNNDIKASTLAKELVKKYSITRKEAYQEVLRIRS